MIGSDKHISTRYLERALVDDLGDAERRLVDQHLATCQDCLQRHESLRFELKALTPHVMSLRPAAPRRSVWAIFGSRWLMPSLAASAALALILVVVHGPEDTLRAKGGEVAPSVLLHRARGSSVVALAANDKIAVGDRIRVSLSPLGSEVVHVLFRDDRGELELFFSGIAKDTPLPGSLEITAPCVPVTLWAWRGGDASLVEQIRAGVPALGQAVTRRLECE